MISRRDDNGEGCHKCFGEAIRKNLLGGRDLSYGFREMTVILAAYLRRIQMRPAPECPAVPRCDLPEIGTLGEAYQLVDDLLHTSPVLHHRVPRMS
jgi:hypothetical protein